jgi:hypothetical protein
MTISANGGFFGQQSWEALAREAVNTWSDGLYRLCLNIPQWHREFTDWALDLGEELSRPNLILERATRVQAGAAKAIGEAASAWFQFAVAQECSWHEQWEQSARFSQDGSMAEAIDLLGQISTTGPRLWRAGPVGFTQTCGSFLDSWEQVWQPLCQEAISDTPV